MRGVTPIVVRKCASLNGALVIDLSNSTTQGAAEVTVLSYNCRNGTFSSVTGITGDECKRAEATESYLLSSMIVSFDITENCASAVTEGGLTELHIILMAVLVPLVLVCIIVAIVVVAVPKLRKKVFPFAHRTHYFRRNDDL